MNWCNIRLLHPNLRLKESKAMEMSAHVNTYESAFSSTTTTTTLVTSSKPYLARWFLLDPPLNEGEWRNKALAPRDRRVGWWQPKSRQQGTFKRVPGLHMKIPRYHWWLVQKHKHRSWNANHSWLFEWHILKVPTFIRTNRPVSGQCSPFRIPNQSGRLIHLCCCYDLQNCLGYILPPWPHGGGNFEQ